MRILKTYSEQILLMKHGSIVRKYCNCLVYTANSEGVYVRTVSYYGKFRVKAIKPVSTIGAGDNFNAGMMAAIYMNQITSDTARTDGRGSLDKSSYQWVWILPQMFV